MKTTTTLLLTLLVATAAWADDSLRSVQTELKSQGFYYGEITGQTSPETTAAVRRYQIRNGLEVTGTLNKETLGALGLGRTQASPPPVPRTPVPSQRPPMPTPKPQVHLRKNEPVEPIEESDREFLLREDAQRSAAAEAARVAPRDPLVLRPPAPLVAPGDDFPVLFAQTPYSTAPREVQQRTLRNAQAALASRGFYRDIIDGLPGPATEEALLTYQRASRLTLTGRLDLPTLSALRLLPGQDSRRPELPKPRERVYRGIWVN